MATTVRWREGGQATAEHIGLTMVVALLLGAMAMWVAGQVWVPDRPPDVIGRLTEPFGVGPAVQAGPPYLVVPPEMRGQPGLFHQVWDGAVSWGLANVDGQVAALGGFVDEMRSQAERVVTDPLGTAARAVVALRGIPGLPVPSPGEPPPDDPATSDPLDQVSLWGYLWDVGKRPWPETMRGLSRIAGKRAADYVVTRWLKWLGGKAGLSIRRP